MQWKADRESFDRLVPDSLPALQRFAIRLTGNREQAEELAQETLLRATRFWESYRGRSQFRTCVFPISNPFP